MCGVKRNLELDLLKFVACLIIVFHHYSALFMGTKIFQGGYVCVELFFLISGYFLAGETDADNGNGVAAFQCVFRRIKNIYPHFMISYLVTYVLRIFMHISPISAGVGTEIQRIIYDILFMTEIGFGGVPILPSWYLSAMFIGMLLLYPLLALSKRNCYFTYVYGPFIACVFYVFLLKRYGTVQSETIYLAAENTLVILPNLMRAFAGLTLGACIRAWGEHSGEWKPVHVKIFKFVEILLLIIVFGVLMQLTSFTSWDFIYILFFVFIVFCATKFEYKTTNERLYRVVAYAAKLSLPIYLFQGVSAYLIMILNERGIQNHIITTGVFWLSLLFISNTSLWFVNKWKRSLK